ncbi:MAG: hypothetical protein IPP31_12560 [Chitinophagaceae bacterium]|nr:hypothetical protein [Chitinophagaceae bacterium]
MSNHYSDLLFQLIHSLEKSEKRHFKLYIKRSSAREELKIIQLFDALGKLKTYDEKALLKKLPGIEKPQLSNLKTHLYKEILSSLRLLKSAESIDLQLNEQHDYAHILYKKGLFRQSLRIIEKAKETARHQHKLNHLVQLIALEKRIETLHITRSIQEKAGLLANEALQVTTQLDHIVKWSNLALNLYSWYIKNGHSSNEADEAGIRRFFADNLPSDAAELTGFYERLYRYQSYSMYAFIRQDFLQYYRYSQKWFDLFTTEPGMIRVETGHYIKAFHNLMNAHFDLRNHQLFSRTLAEFEQFAATERVQQNENFRVQAFIYISNARLNRHFMQGTFREGLKEIPALEEKIAAYDLYLDKHRIIVFNYKMALMHFGCGRFETCIDYLQRIINDPVDLRYDLQCYARLLHLMAHFELGNMELVEPLSRSVYRFMSKMKKFTVVEEEIFRFLRQRINKTGRTALQSELKDFLQRVKQFEKNRFETRAFAYLDVISWVESKVYRRSMGEVIHEKFLSSKKRNYTPVHHDV